MGRRTREKRNGKERKGKERREVVGRVVGRGVCVVS